MRLTALSILFFSLAYFYLLIISEAGICFVAYCVIAEKSVDFETAFRASQNLVWRAVAVLFLLLLLVVPYALLLAYFIGKLPGSGEFNQSIAYAFIPQSIFTAMSFFPLTEMIVYDTKILISLRTAWFVFTHQFFTLAVTGLLLRAGLYIMFLLVSITLLLLQNHFDFAVISTLNWIRPQLTSPYSINRLITAIPQVIWMIYCTTTFTFAYLRYKNAGKRDEETNQEISCPLTKKSALARKGWISAASLLYI